jgi:carboxylate-amine ligase
LPLLLALSTSSPFWQSHDTGLRGYRLAAYDELPRTGLPELFRTTAEYDDYVDALVRSGAMKDSSYIWWAVRPSHKYPTLELRAPDCCTSVRHGVSVAALYRTLIRHLYRNPHVNRDMDAVARAIAVENKWQAQRFGIHGTFATDDGPLTVAEMLDLVIEQTMADAEALGCAAELDGCRQIVAHGTSADAQLQAFYAYPDHDDKAAAFRAVCEWIASATLKL